MIAWLYCDFRPYAIRQGLSILHEDMKFIESKLYKIPVGEQRKVMRQYIAEWKRTMDECLDELKKQNNGRRAANIYLRQQVG